MTVRELKVFRAKLIKARSLADLESRAWLPLIDAGLYKPIDGGLALKCNITMLGMPLDSWHFYLWCRSVDVCTVRLMYDRSIAAIDAQIAKAKP